MVAVLVGGSEGRTHHAAELIIAGAGGEGDTGDGAGGPESWPGISATLHLPTPTECQSHGTPVEKEAIGPAPLALPRNGRAPSRLHRGRDSGILGRSTHLPPPAMLSSLPN